jgi:signal transduction histidine kinase
MLQLIVIQLFCITLAGICVNLFYPTQSATNVILTLVALAALQTVLAPWFIKRLTRPIEAVTQAVLHVSNEISDTPPPNVNNKESERSGLKALVQAIYELAASPTALSSPKGVTGTGSDIAIPLVEQLPVAVIVYDHQDKLRFVNARGRSLLPDIKDDVLTIDQLRLIFPTTAQLKAWVLACRQEKIQETHIWQRVPDRDPSDPDRKLYDVVVYYNKNESHGIETTLVVIDRTSEYLATEEAMDFISLAAHELRGPITVIRGYLEVLVEALGPKLEADQKVLMERLDVSAGQLAGYINNILNVARFDHNHLNLHLREENWIQILQSYLPELELRAQAHNRKLTIKLPAELPTVAADVSSMQEVVTNLIDNAIKYSHDGGEIIITAYKDEDFIETTVQDFGIGIPGSIVGHLFTKFYRSHRSRETITGTGLGLYLCKAIVESHGGTIWVRSEEGQGATFGFRLPIYASVAATMQNEDNSNKDIIHSSHGWIKNHTYYRG